MGFASISQSICVQHSLGASLVRQVAPFRAGMSVESLSHPRAKTFGSLPFHLLLIFERNSTVSHDNLKHKQQTNLDLAPPPSPDPARSSFPLPLPWILCGVYSVEFAVFHGDLAAGRLNPVPEAKRCGSLASSRMFPFSSSYLLGERREAAQPALTIRIEFPRVGCW
ncbi:hypothetical protein R3P38DRAFT_3173327 [Favolaschia claudopus]|uniref:Uncharacterized protein n=1 Tax=Favolaschia claudopus TaxID=2862362 RepID=A0AAW0DEM9_9AGAR